MRTYKLQYNVCIKYNYIKHNNYNLYYIKDFFLNKVQNMMIFVFPVLK